MNKNYINMIRLGFFFAFVLPFYSFAQNKASLNQVAQKHFSTGQIEALTTPEISAINYMFSSSYIVDTSTMIYKKWVKENGAIDIVMLNPRRKKSERTFFRDEKYPGFVIEFYSKDEVENQVKKILNTPQN